MPNALAYVVLFSWPLVAWYLFKKLTLTQAVIATVMLGYLFIPEETFIKIPMIPPISKDTMPSLCAAIGILLTRRANRGRDLRASRRIAAAVSAEAGSTQAGSTQAGPLPRGGYEIRNNSRISHAVPLIAFVLFMSTILTWYTNQEPLFYGPLGIPGLRPYDIGSMMINVVLVLLPLLLARKELRTRDAQIDFLKIFTVCGLVYTPLMLWEERMSPQLNVHLYGFFAASFAQHVRDGEFRPIVFLAHGLRVGIFITMAILAAAALYRAGIDGAKRKRWLWAALWLTLNLALSHNFGATAIAVIFMAVILFLPLRLQFLIAGVVALLVLLYPVARGSGFIPAQNIETFIAGYSAERADSLGVRLENEDALLAKAERKPLSGWGGWGRNRLYDPDSGKDESITDGTWVMTIGTSGWVGYLGYFGLICLPILFSMLRARRYEIDAIGVGTIMLLVANIIDLIPNSSMVPILWLTAGTVWGRLEAGSTRKAVARLAQQLRPNRRAASPTKTAVGPAASGQES